METVRVQSADGAFYDVPKAAADAIAVAAADQRYDEAAARSAGRYVASYFATLLEKGMKRGEALHITTVWLQGLMWASQHQPQETTDEG